MSGSASFQRVKNRLYSSCALAVSPSIARARATRQRTGPTVPDNAAVVENLPKLSGGLRALSGREIRLSANVGRNETGDLRDEPICPELNRGRRSLQVVEGFGRIFTIQGWELDGVVRH